MKKLSEYYSETLSLIQPKFSKRYFELRSKDELLCTMNYPKFFSTNAIIECREKKWEIKSKKFWSLNLLISEAGSEIPEAEVNVHFFKRSEILLPRGQKLLIKNFIFGMRTMLMTELENPLITIETKFSFKDKKEVIIEYGTKQVDEYPWLIMLLLYMDIRNRRQRNAG